VGETIVDNWRAEMGDLQVATRDGGAPSTKTSATLQEIMKPRKQLWLSLEMVQPTTRVGCVLSCIF
jgi:hypothetical protein